MIADGIFRAYNCQNFTGKERAMSQVPNPFNSYRDPGGQPMDYAAAETTSQAVARFFNAVYAWMCAGLGLTALVAWYVAQPENRHILLGLGGGGLIALFIGELALVWVISASIRSISAGVATMLFLLYAGINGIVLSAVFIVYTHSVLASAFAISAGMFGAMSVYGFVTRKDLSGMGSIFFMALIGLIIASVVNAFMRSSALNMLINYAGVLIFVGLTAYDTQKLKQIAIMTAGDAAFAARLSISGALSLYLDFINLFLFLARILADRK